MEEDIKEAYIESYKEIKRNKDVVKSIDKDYFFEFADYLINRNKELEEDYTSVYLKGIYDERDKWKSKVKEKIEKIYIAKEEEDNKLSDMGFDLGQRNYLTTKEQIINVLQELLED